MGTVTKRIRSRRQDRGNENFFVHPSSRGSPPRRPGRKESSEGPNVVSAPLSDPKVGPAVLEGPGGREGTVNRDSRLWTKSGGETKNAGQTY